MKPILLPANSIEHEYLGGDLIAALRGGPGGPNRPEEWLGSTTTRFGSESDGLTMIDGVALRDLIEADPTSWLGPDHVERFGSSAALLVKLLHAGQRLPVHLHPSQAFATNHLNCPFGKSEAWLVVDRDRADTTVFVGTNQAVDRAQWQELIAAQDSDAMLELMNPISVEVGDGIFVPSGTPHAIGEGLLIMELQEPTDFSILLEWEGFAFDGPADGHLNLGYDVALNAIDPDPLDSERLSELILRPQASTAGIGRALPTAADPYFKLSRIELDQLDSDQLKLDQLDSDQLDLDQVAANHGPVALPHSFGILLVTEGSGSLTWNDSIGTGTGTTTGANLIAVNRGDALVVPYGCGPVALEGEMTAFYATPPSPDANSPIEFDQHVVL